MEFKRKLKLNASSDNLSIEEAGDAKISAANQFVAMLAEIAGIEKPYSKFTTNDGEERIYVSSTVVQATYDAMNNK